MAPCALRLRRADAVPSTPTGGELHAIRINKRHQSPALVLLRCPSKCVRRRVRGAKPLECAPGPSRGRGHLASQVAGSSSGRYGVPSQRRRRGASAGGEGRSRRTREAAGVCRGGVSASSPRPARPAVAAAGVGRTFAVGTGPSGGRGAAALQTGAVPPLERETVPRSQQQRQDRSGSGSFTG